VVFKEKNILLISPEPWDHIFISKHHYAVYLAKRGNRVFFLNPPSPELSISKTGYQNVFLVNYRGFIKGMRFLPRWLQRLLMRGQFRKLEHLCQCSFQIIWSFDNSVFYDFSAFPSDILTISHIVDLNQDFQTEVAAATADVCLATTDLIEKRLRKFSDQVYKINHGYHEVIALPEIVMPGASPVKAVYAGNLSMPYIDWKILIEVVSSNPGVDFLLIGPDGSADHDGYKAALLQQPNVFRMGKMSSDLLSGFLNEADILLVCYQEKYFDEQANPHKMMEYLGTGKVVVATFTGEFRSQKNLIEMSASNKELPDIFRRVVSDLPYFNNKLLVNRRKAFAIENSYDRQIERIERIVNAYDEGFSSVNRTKL